MIKVNSSVTGSYLKVHYRVTFFFVTFFAETKSLLSQGPVIEIFENPIRFCQDIRLINISAYAQPAMKLFQHMLSQH
jgi:hypothetical protein